MTFEEDMQTIYASIEGLSIKSLNIKKSEFIAFANYVDSEQSARDFINEIKRRHKTARHNVFAYVIRDEIERYSDDGEPKGTAGMPILNTIKRCGLTNVCVVVTRYFGGILLGASGLLRAYSNVATDVLVNCERVKLILCNQYRVQVFYDNLEKIRNLVVDNGGKLIGEKFMQQVEIEFAIPKENSKKIIEELKVKSIDFVKSDNEVYLKFK